MRYKQFGATDMQVSAISVGGWAIGGAGWGAVDRSSCIEAIHAMLDNGVNMIDTAPGYNAGESERIIGEAVKGRRDKLYLLTKTALYNGDGGEAPGIVKDGRRETVLRLCDESLRNLKTDYIDIMLIHWPDIEHNAPIEETMTALMDLKKAGKIRYAGVSNFSVEQIEEARQYGELVALEPPYSMVNRSSEELMKWAHAQGIANLTYGSLGAGILTGAIRQLPEFAPDDMRLVFYDFFVEPRFSQVMQLLRVLDEIAAAHHAPLAQLAINWSTQKEFVTTALCGVRNSREANENCAGLDWSLSGDEIRAIDQAIATYLN